MKKSIKIFGAILMIFVLLFISGTFFNIGLSLGFFPSGNCDDYCQYCKGFIFNKACIGYREPCKCYDIDLPRGQLHPSIENPLVTEESTITLEHKKSKTIGVGYMNINNYTIYNPKIELNNCSEYKTKNNVSIDKITFISTNISKIDSGSYHGFIIGVEDNGLNNGIYVCTLSVVNETTKMYIKVVSTDYMKKYNLGNMFGFTIILILIIFLIIWIIKIAKNGY